MNTGGQYKPHWQATTVKYLTLGLPILFAALLLITPAEPALSTIFIIAWLAICILQIFHLTHLRCIDIDDMKRDRHAAALERDRMMTIVNNLADAIIVTDNDGVVQIANAATLALLDTNVSVIGKKVSSIAKLSDTATGAPYHLLPELKKARAVATRDDIDLKLGDERLHLSLIYSPIRGTSSESTSDNRDGYIIIMRDITREKSLEEERDEFISVVSHELRTPITIAEGSLSNLQALFNRGKATDAMLKNGVAMAHDQILFLSSMINDLSTLSRAERGVADAADVIDLEPFMHSLFKQYLAEATKKGLRLNLDLDPQIGSVTASELYLHELLQNFVTNAIKYTKVGSVTIRVKKQRGDMLEFSVQDSGIGISKADQKHVFEKFFRSEDYRTRETGGTGLGLYVAAKLARKLQTQVTLESRLNHGSTFGFSLPSTPKQQ